MTRKSWKEYILFDLNAYHFIRLDFIRLFKKNAVYRQHTKLPKKMAYIHFYFVALEKFTFNKSLNEIIDKKKIVFYLL